MSHHHGGGGHSRHGSGGSGGRYVDHGRSGDAGPPADYYDERSLGGPPSSHHRGGGGHGRRDSSRGDRGGFRGRGGGGGGRDYMDRRGGGRHRGGPSPPRGGGGGHSRGGAPPPPPGAPKPHHTVRFHSFEEEQEWVAERRRKRLARPSKFDQGVPAVGGGLALPGGVTGTAATATVPTDPLAVAAAAAAALAASAGPQQTRHARRLYVGNLPLGTTEQQIHEEFRNAILTAYTPQPPLHPPLDPHEDPILSVYINHERRFCFLEFRTVEMTTACMMLDGYTLTSNNNMASGPAKLKIKRPNDYSEALAPRVAPQAIPPLDVSKLGMISNTVLDGPNKIFIGGLHYHLQDAQVLELLQAFGPIKAFHLVKGGGSGDHNDMSLSKGYCFCEYVDPHVTATAIAGLNGMDIGGGKTLTARLAGERMDGMTGTSIPGLGVMTTPGAAAATVVPPGQAAQTDAAEPLPGHPPLHRTIIHGYDIEALVDAAMGLPGTIMPTVPQYTDHMGIPLTRIVPLALQQQQQEEAAAAAAEPLAAPPTAATTGTSASQSHVLQLSNMVQEEDLATDADYEALVQEIRDECQKFGELKQVKIPRRATNDAAAAALGETIEPSAVGKVFLHYAALDQAAAAMAELQGRQFGDAVVQVTYYNQDDFDAGRLR